MSESPREAATRRAVRAGRLDREMELNAPLGLGEVTVVHGIVRCRWHGLPRLSYLRVSATRICVVQHYALRPDQLTEIPRAAVTQASVEGVWVRLSFTRQVVPVTLILKPWEHRLRRIVVEPVLETSLQELCVALSS